MEYIFRMVAEATEEAVLNSLVTSEETHLEGKETRYSLKDLYFKEV